MKKIAVLAVCLFVAVVGANAQIALGIKGGANFANIDVDGFDPDSRTGFHFGAFAEVGLAGIAIQPELLFSTKGAEDFDLSYLEIPILLKKSFAKILNIHVGPQFGILTKAELNDNDIKDGLKSADLSAVVGAGVDLPGGIVGGARYVFGLSDIDDGGLSTDIKNRTLQLYVGYKLFGN